jgi:rfaE bifunctional protein kinase chain/domain
MSDGAAARDFVRQVRAGGPGRTVVMVTGNFNVLHPGHIRILKFAKDLGDRLVVGVSPDGTAGATLPAATRLESVRAHKDVDFAFVLAEPIDRVIAELKPEIVVKGREHEFTENPEQAALARHGGKLIFSSGAMFTHTWDEFESSGRAAVRAPEDYLQRRAIGAAALERTLEAAAKVRVLVIGEVIVDEYVDCDALGLSQEDPTIVVTPVARKSFLGGAGIVAAHARGTGAQVHFASVVGDDDHARFAKEKLAAAGVAVHLPVDDSRPTVHKQRFRSSGKTLLRVNSLRQHAISQELRADLLGHVRARLPETDLILFSDFNYGCLPTELVREIGALAQARGVPMAADSQASSQLSDITRFRNMRLITPTEHEARISLKDQSSGLVVLAERLREAAACEHVVITLGADGMLVHTGRDGGVDTDRLPALNSAPRDVAGAGDSFFCLSSLALAAGADIWSAALLGSIAAACQVSRVGNMPLSGAELREELRRAVRA